ncbi:SDR family oxidoreductase [Thalassovita taeanensis]|uniref:Citronellol/citronellal dehydrogenase n=1 Tax=Thalassovita taeanensis TaxID=657014 RepID=A0A1H9BAF1_9RHOB|nr:NAD(P)-dependent oxidoreductase [Thalassovita taeanensis]SEP85653.1 citronellol/citronellal dehydrogenase [Thalassovita taeanensis]
MTQTPLENQTLFITGASRGIGLEIAKRAARDGANIVVAAKTMEPHPTLPGTIFTAADEIEALGGKALPLQLDVRDDKAVEKAVAQAAQHFGGIDILVNNASAINLANTDDVQMKRFDLMHQVNTRGTYLMSKTALPYLRKSANAHILMLSPPLDMDAKWFAPHIAYTMAKFGMSMCVLGLAEEVRADGIAVNALWPRTTVATSAVQNVIGSALMNSSRTPEIMADAAYAIFCRDASTFTGNFVLDDEVLAEAGVSNFDTYRVNPSCPLQIDMFVQNSRPFPKGSTLAAVK